MKFSLGRLGALTTTGVLLALAGAGAPAGAQTAAPAPCPGAAILKDAKGDQEYTRVYALGLDQTTVAAPASYDVTQVFLTYGDAPGKKLRAHLVIDNLTAEQIDEVWADDARYSVEMDFAGTFIRATAIQDDGQWSFIYSSDAVATPSESPIQQRRYLSETDTTGSTVPGVNGVVSIDVPEDALPGLKVGDKVNATGYTWAHTGTQVGGSRVDDAPDDRAMKSFTLMECAPAPVNNTTNNTNTNTPNQGGNTPNQNGTNPSSNSGGETGSNKKSSKKAKKAKKCKKARGKAKGHTKRGFKRCPKAKKKKGKRA